VGFSYVGDDEDSEHGEVQAPQGPEVYGQKTDD